MHEKQTWGRGDGGGTGGDALRKAPSWQGVRDGEGGHTLLEASMNLTPLYVMDRMMVGIFFMCSVDFYSKREAHHCRSSGQDPTAAAGAIYPGQDPTAAACYPSHPQYTTAHDSLPASWHRRPVWILSLADL